MKDVHYHCGICDDGDYDLCETCVKAGKLCPGKEHWLIKRFIKDGSVVGSTTEKIVPKSKPEAEQTKMPGAFSGDLLGDLVPVEPQRTCNACVRGE